MIPLSTCLNLELVRPCAVLAGADGLDRVMIRHIAVMERPVDDFVREHELVLTTALGCLEDEAAFVQYVTELYNAKAAAVCISVKSARYRIPQGVVDYAAAVGLPLIRIPWKARFADIVKAVNQLITRAEESIRVKRRESAIQQIYYILGQSPEMEQIARQTLHRLVEYDREKGAQLFETLWEYVQQDKNVSATARAMHLHRQSLLYRLGRIEDLTGLSMGSHRDLFLLEICVRLYADLL